MTDKVLIVTGGSRGIGAATCRLAGRLGYAVSVNYQRDAAAANAVVAEIGREGGKAIAVQADVARATEVERLFAETDKRLGRVTHLVNNAGIVGRAQRLDSVDVETLERVFALNITGAFLCARAAVRLMSTQHGGAGGAIVNLSSAAATLGAPGEFIWYAASKGAMDTLTIGLAKEVAREGIRVNAVAPGLILTEIHAASGEPGRVDRLTPMVPVGRAGTAEEVAETILFLLSEQASYVTGSVLRVSGGR
jgi:NAD(P)-dependent dehydrogenase (short-subunit alcohol dehydrogenase family)